MPERIDIKKLVESVGRQQQAALLNRAGPDFYSDVTGFHIYGELNLTLRLTAATDAKDAQRLLLIFQEYTLLAEACAAESGAILLEVQGERIHLLLPVPKADRNSIIEVLKFSVAFTNAVYLRIGKTAGKEFKGFTMATDHGRAILVSSGVQLNGSIVSLGPAANTPAKEMKKRGEAAHLRIRSEHYALVTNEQYPKGWINIPVLEPSTTVQAVSNSDLANRFSRAADQYLQEAKKDLQVQFADSRFLESFQGGYVNNPVKVQGFVLRADLDGFSKQVEAAFNAGDHAIAALVARFLLIMKYPAQFRSRIGKTIDLPMAGDCATVVVLPGNCSYEESREFLPAKAAAEWHSQRGGQDAQKRNWSEATGDANWAVGIAGGDDKEGSDGYVLIAPLAGKHRDFLVGSGWGVGRSLDAQEADGVKGEDTVIPQIDYTALETAHQKTFEKLDSRFWISHGLTTDSLKASGISSFVTQPKVFVPNISKPLPEPKPWFNA